MLYNGFCMRCFRSLLGVCVTLWCIKVCVKRMCFDRGCPRCSEFFVLLLQSGWGARSLMQFNSVLFRVTVVSSFAGVTALQVSQFFSSLVTLPYVTKKEVSDCPVSCHHVSLGGELTVWLGCLTLGCPLVPWVLQPLSNDVYGLRLCSFRPTWHIWEMTFNINVWHQAPLCIPSILWTLLYCLLSWSEDFFFSPYAVYSAVLHSTVKVPHFLRVLAFLSVFWSLLSTGPGASRCLECPSSSLPCCL